MFPTYSYTDKLALHNDDIQAIQMLYGVGNRQEALTTQAPPRPIPTTLSPDMPSYCNMRIQAAFRILGITFLLTSDPDQSNTTVVYKVDQNGLDPNSRVPLSQMFKKKSSERWPRAHPYSVDAATFLPSTRQIFLFSTTRVYRYTFINRDEPLYLDESAGYPKWIDVSEFPERPRAAVPMPLANHHNHYYMLIFGKTRVWNWVWDRQRVGAVDYPISSFGRNMPHNVHTAFLENRNTVVFIKNDRYIRFDVGTRHVSDKKGSEMSVKRNFFKGHCL